jgi:hypothetical protein
VRRRRRRRRRSKIFNSTLFDGWGASSAREPLTI